MNSEMVNIIKRFTFFQSQIYDSNASIPNFLEDCLKIEKSVSQKQMKNKNSTDFRFNLTSRRILE